MKSIYIPAVLVMASLVLLTGCGKDRVTDTGPEYSRTTPEGLIEALAYALEEKDADIYAECLHDEYLFTFTAKDADDMGLPPGTPWWDKTDDVQAMNKMFNDPTVREIECLMPVYVGPPQAPDTATYRLELSLKVPIIEEDAEQGIIMWANHSWLDVEIVPDPYDGDKWVFRGIREEWKGDFGPGSAPAMSQRAEYTSFGSIKAMFWVED
ncbi:MAG: hypothetical protein PVF95_14100 [bacterium]|jgi:hypothetical protein